MTLFGDRKFNQDIEFVTRMPTQNDNANKRCEKHIRSEIKISMQNKFLKEQIGNVRD